PYAAGDRNEKRKLFVSAGHSNHSLIRGFAAAERELEVEAVRIDDILAHKGIREVHFAKLDIEGAESLALAGMAETIRRSPQIQLLVEYNPTALAAAEVSPAVFLEIIRNLGLEPSAILEDGRLGPVPGIGEIGSYLNLICSRAV